ncbi:MAG: 4Fe-4S dicluster domain-containing protein [Desulfovibrio sp.]|nr:MAG: 4Fe-4S dicluster domain-containing protein [Desulfovibrio sp.]
MQESKRFPNQSGWEYFWTNLKDLWSLIVGLRVTGSNFIKPVRTTFYPRETVAGEDFAPYRGHIELVGKPKDPATPKCVVCMMCAKVCPSGCITLKKAKAPEAKEGEEKPKAPKTPSSFNLNYNLCSLCGLCVQACPAKSLRHSNNVYLAGFERADFEFDLMARLRNQAAKSGSTAEDKAA